MRNDITDTGKCCRNCKHKNLKSDDCPCNNCFDILRQGEQGEYEVLIPPTKWEYDGGKGR